MFWKILFRNKLDLSWTTTPCSLWQKDFFYSINLSYNCSENSVKIFIFKSVWHDSFGLIQLLGKCKVAGVKVYQRQTWNYRPHAVSACIGLWHHRLMHAHHRPMHACTACIAPWHHRLNHAITEWALLFWFCLRYSFTSNYFG